MSTSSSTTAANLCLHYVSGDSSKRRLTLSRDQLRELVRLERAAGRRAVSLADYLHEARPTADCFSISFDDAHASILKHAAPVLAELDVPATLFVPTAYVDTSGEFLSWDDLRALRDLGWLLGSHSVTHPRMGPRLYDEDEEALSRRLLEECERSREVMQRHLGAAPALFAYPYGEAPEPAVDAARRAGYRAAFTVGASREWDGNLLSIPRLAGEGRVLPLDEGVDRAHPEEAAEDEGQVNSAHVDSARVESARVESARVDSARVDSTGAEAARESGPTRISVIVPAYNRAGILSEVVTRLASQSYPEDRYEVVVIDDGSDDDLSPIFAEMPDNVRCVRHGDSNFRAGQARQHGAQLARYGVLAFLDADIVVGPDYLWHLDWVHRHTHDAVVLGYLSGYNLHSIGHVHTLDDVRGVDLESLPLIPDRSREAVLRPCLDNVDWLEDAWTLAYTGNLSLSRELLFRIGAFADDFVGWGLEDVDLGYRLSKAGAKFVFSRYAIGYHIEDLSEPAPRNPFRRASPNREDFAGYLENLEILGRRHAGDPVMADYVRRNLVDVEETCSRPHTVGIEFGGVADVPSRFHRMLHRIAPGGVPTHELLDRVAYGKKIGAQSAYLLGGAPSEHRGFLEVVRAAKSAGLWVALRSPVYPFARDGLAAAAKDAGLDAVTCELHSLDQDAHEALHGPGTFAELRRGLEALGEAGIRRSARVIVSPETLGSFPLTLSMLSKAGIPVDEVEVTDMELSLEVQKHSPVPVQLASP